MSVVGRQIFSEFERNLLLDIIGEYLHIIESKDTNKIINIQKAKAWDEIAKIFSSTQGANERSAKQLKTCYLNFKKRAGKTKVKCVLDRIRSSKCSTPVLSENDETILGLETDFDSSEGGLTIKKEAFDSEPEEVTIESAHLNESEFGESEVVENWRDEDTVENMLESAQKPFNVYRKRTKQKGQIDAYIAAKEAKRDFYINENIRAQERHEWDKKAKMQAEEREKEKHALEVKLSKAKLEQLT